MMRRTSKTILSAALIAAATSAMAQENVAEGTGALLRGLDKINAETQDLDLPIGATGQVGSLTVTLEDCRYPQDNPAGDAFAFLTIRDTRNDANSAPIFSGWMIASSPALNALDHFRYDIWVLRCDLPAGVTPRVQEAPAPEVELPQDPDRPVD